MKLFIFTGVFSFQRFPHFLTPCPTSKQFSFSTMLTIYLIFTGFQTNNFFLDERNCDLGLEYYQLRSTSGFNQKRDMILKRKSLKLASVL